jgi:O-antigen/teichoic acid export membrane protein
MTARANSWFRDVATAYLATSLRLGSWFVICVLVYRFFSRSQFAMFVLIEATLGLLDYAALGLGPSIIHAMAHAGAGEASNGPAAGGHEGLLAVHRVYSNGMTIAAATSVAAIGLVIAYALNLSHVHRIPVDVSLADLRTLALALGLSSVVRFPSDVFGAVLQVSGRIWLDNLLLAGTELCSAIGAAIVCVRGQGLTNVGMVILLSSVVLLLARAMLTGRGGGIRPRLQLLEKRTFLQLLMFGLSVVTGQLADFLYAPLQYILINRMLRPIDLAVFAPAEKIASGAVVLVAAFSNVLLPRAALAHAAEGRQSVRRLFTRSMLLSFTVAVLVIGAIWLATPLVLRIWQRQPMPQTSSLLPGMLLAAIFGGVGTVGRAILIAINRVKAYSASVLLAGFANAVLCFVFLKWTNYGLGGIVLALLIVVFARAVIWMPWYVLRALRT